MTVPPNPKIPFQFASDAKLGAALVATRLRPWTLNQIANAYPQAMFLGHPLEKLSRIPLCENEKWKFVLWPVCVCAKSWFCMWVFFVSAKPRPLSAPRPVGIYPARQSSAEYSTDEVSASSFSACVRLCLRVYVCSAVLVSRQCIGTHACRCPHFSSDRPSPLVPTPERGSRCSLLHGYCALGMGTFEQTSMFRIIDLSHLFPPWLSLFYPFLFFATRFITRRGATSDWDVLVFKHLFLRQIKILTRPKSTSILTPIQIKT